MTARHDPRPAPSKRAIRREQQDLHAITAAIVYMAQNSPDVRAVLHRKADMLTRRSGDIGRIVRRLQWVHPEPMRVGLVTWPTRRRRRRRTR